jgi:hypothetical protein
LDENLGSKLDGRQHHCAKRVTGAIDFELRAPYNVWRLHRPTRKMPFTARKRSPTAPSSQVGPDEVTEQAIRSLVKARLPRLVRSPSGAFLVEEMEVCSGRARIDLAVIGDRLIGIEIKGPRDDVTRLPGQAKAYSQCFDYVVLIVHESLALKARTLIPEWWGFIVGGQVDGRVRYRVERRPEPNPCLNLETVLSLLWREEIDALLTDLLGGNSKPKATKKSIRAELLAQVEPPILHLASLRKLRERTEWRGVPI